MPGFALPVNTTTCEACAGSNCECANGALMNCTDCISGFAGHFDATAETCTACPENCDSCATNATVCDTCMIGYYKSSTGICTACITGCGQCNNNPFECDTDECLPGYFDASSEMPPVTGNVTAPIIVTWCVACVDPLCATCTISNLGV